MSMNRGDDVNPSAIERYLEIVKRSLLNELYPELEAQLLYTVLCLANGQPLTLEALQAARDDGTLATAIRAARQGGDTLVLRGRDGHGKVVDRPDLRNYTEFAQTMIGRARLDHLQQCAQRVIREGVPGDFLEAGVWRGGAGVLLAAVVAAHDARDRRVWLADSFQGVPPPRLVEDAGVDLSADVLPVLSVGEGIVRSLFERYDLDGENIRFIPGWFRESLPHCAVERLAVLRVDGDLYESTRDALVHLYPKVVEGGYVIIDDYGILEPCRRAVEEFRLKHGAGETLHAIDGHGVFWRRGAA